MKIKKGKSKHGNFIEDVACEACHGPGEAYEKVKKNYKGKVLMTLKNSQYRY